MGSILDKKHSHASYAVVVLPPHTHTHKQNNKNNIHSVKLKARPPKKMLVGDYLFSGDKLENRQFLRG